MNITTTLNHFPQSTEPRELKMNHNNDGTSANLPTPPSQRLEHPHPHTNGASAELFLVRAFSLRNCFTILSLPSCELCDG